MPKRSSKKAPRDVNALARFLVDEATGNKAPEPAQEIKSEAARMLGRLGGLKGGKARAAALSKKERAEIAKLAASARWKKSK